MLLFSLSHKAHGEQLPLIPKLTLYLLKSHHFFPIFWPLVALGLCSSLLLSRKQLGPPQLLIVEYPRLLRQMNHLNIGKVVVPMVKGKGPYPLLQSVALFYLSYQKKLFTTKSKLTFCSHLNSLCASAFQHLYSWHSTSLFHNLLPTDMLRNDFRCW